MLAYKLAVNAGRTLLTTQINGPETDNFVAIQHGRNTNPQMLIVDDDPMMRLVLRRIMEQEGFRVVEVSDGEECIAAFPKVRPEIVLMDAIMPVMDGFAACAEIRRRYGEQIPVLMITTLDDRASVDRAFAAGASDFITKPIHIAVLCQRVRRLFETRQAEASLRESQRTLATLLSNLPGMAYRRYNDPAWTMDFVSEGATELIGYHPVDLMREGHISFVSLIHPDDCRMVSAEVAIAIEEQRPFRITYRIRAADGTQKWVWEQGRAVTSASDASVILEGFIIDVTERKAVEEQLSFQAFHDALTGLPNRALFIDRLDHALAGMSRRCDRLALLFLDLDHFKVINDTLGHKAGDQLLRQVGERLLHCLRPGDTVARLGGDEFTLLLEGVSDVQEAAFIAERIAEQLQVPFLLDGHEFVVTTSIGIALRGEEQTCSADLLRNADLALYEAKYRGRACYAIFNPQMNSRAWERLELESELRRAIDRNELCVFYQPVVDLETGCVGEVEALLRWQHPRRGLLMPGSFIPLAEETGLIVKLSEWVLETACRQVQTWHVAYPNERRLAVSVNLSARQFQHLQIAEQVAHILEKTGLDPAYLKLEITESSMMQHEERTITTLDALKSLGITLVVDDFGIGYSALSTLKRFPIDMLKIDRSFTAGLGVDAEDTAIVRAVIGFASALDLGVTAEGIETEHQVEILRTLGCHRGQGFFFGHPQPPEVFSLHFSSLPVVAPIF